MVVVTLTDVPAKLRGDLSKWLIEVNTGVFVGNINPRVREELWKRICENLKTGKATMVFSARGEQGMDFLIHNSSRKVEDYDGLKLVKMINNNSVSLPKGYSKAAQFRKIHKVTSARAMCATQENDAYVVVDIETTGLNVSNDEIIELSALSVENGNIISEYSSPIKCSRKLNNTIVRLTGITDEFLEKNGIPIKDVLATFLEYIGNSRLVFHNAAFDLAFLNASLERNGFSSLSNTYEDTMEIAKKLLPDISGYKLSTLSDYFKIDGKQIHRALEDCILTMKVYECLRSL